MKNINKNNFLVLGLVGLLGVSAFFVGTFYQKVKTLEKQAGNSPDTAEVAGEQAPQAPKTADNVPPVDKNDHIRGNKDAQVFLIEYSDYECPYCKNFHLTAKQAVDEYNGKVAWIYRHFPLAFHQNAQKEAEASECAAEFGGNDSFWEYSNKIFERTSSNGTGFALDDLVPLAGEIGLDENKFKECLDSGKYEQNIKDEMAGGSLAGISGTPGNILLNAKTNETQLIPGAVPFEQLKQAIDSML